MFFGKKALVKRDSSINDLVSDIALDYNDIDLISYEISTIKSRNQIIVSQSNFKLLSNPLIIAPMVDCFNDAALAATKKHYSTTIVHRFQSIEDQLQIFKNTSPAHVYYQYHCIGISNDDISRFLKLYDAGCRSFCIDVANAANEYVVKFANKIESLTEEHNNIHIMTGNVQTYKQYKYLAENIKSLTSVRLGVAGGCGCSTKNATGIYSPPVSTLLHFRDKPRINDVAIIADGGIREPQDYVKALALGADYVMAGSIFAACKDSPAETIKRGNKTFKKFSGSASAKIQSSYKEVPRYIEGKTVEVPCNNMTFDQLFNSYEEGLKSAMSYFNARDLKQFKNNATWIYKK